MVTCIAIYASFAYGVLYMTLVMFDIVYRELRQWGVVVATLPFLGLMVGVIAAMFINLANQPRYGRAMEKNKNRAVPEARLPPMAVGGWLFVVGIFWSVEVQNLESSTLPQSGCLCEYDTNSYLRFGWTANPKFHWAIPTVATCFIGAGFNVIFQQCINFLVDTYGMYAGTCDKQSQF